jgi:hypothetical protein
MYKLKGSDHVYSDKEFPVAAVDQHKIAKTFYISCSKVGQDPSRSGRSQQLKIVKEFPKQSPHNSKGKQTNQGVGKEVKMSRCGKPLVHDAFISHGNITHNEGFYHTHLTREEQAKRYYEEPNVYRNKCGLGFEQVDTRTCFRCNEVGHIVDNCPLLAHLRSQPKQTAPISHQKIRPQQTSSRNKSGLNKRKFSNFEKEKIQKERKKEVKMILKNLNTSNGFVSDSSENSSDQSKFYQKRAFKHQVWLPKDIEITGGASNAPTGQWMDVTVQDDHGRPKTIWAWVPNSN